MITNKRNYSLSHNDKQSNNQYKAKRVREEGCKQKIIPRHVIKKEMEELDEKLLRNPPSQNNPLVNKLEYKDTKKTIQA